MTARLLNLRVTTFGGYRKSQLAFAVLLNGLDSRRSECRPLIVHVVYQFDTGGLENGIVNLLNHLPRDEYRHVVVALAGVSDFSCRVVRDDVTFFSLEKRAGHGFWLYPQLYQLFRRLKPSIVHTRNLAALETVVPAWVARVPVRIHGEHGRDVGDYAGDSLKYQIVRKFYRPFVSHFIALSRELATYLTDKISVPADQISQIYNGVDLSRFYVAGTGRRSIVDCPFNDPNAWLIGTVGRMQVVKDQLTLVRAFVQLIRERPELGSTVRLVMVGEGPLRSQAFSLLENEGLSSLAWMPGERVDIPEIMRGLDCFVLPSLAEGISNTILEAMASGLPVIATNVGGNADLVLSGKTGEIVPSGDPSSIAHCLSSWIDSPDYARQMGLAGRRQVEERFSMKSMVLAYRDVYASQLERVVSSSLESKGK